MQELESRTTVLAALQVLVFFGGITIPLVGTLVGDSADAEASEKRRFSEPPHLLPTERAIAEDGTIAAHLDALGAYPSAFDAFFDDHFGLRASLIHAHNRAKIALGIAPNERVVIGRDGWMFFADQRAIEQYRAIEPFAHDELEEWIDRFVPVDEWLDDRGIEYLLFFAPAKPTVHPEFLPPDVRRIGRESRLDQLLRTLAERSSVRCVDPREGFERAKSAHPLFWRTDTHWNTFGSFAGYREIVDALHADFPATVVLDVEDFTIDPVQRIQGDLATLVGLGDVLTEQQTGLALRADAPFEWVEGELVPMSAPDLDRDPVRRAGTHRSGPVATERDVDGLPSAVLFHDSFGHILIPFLASSLRRGVYYHQFLVDPEVVDRERPDVVIQEIGERVLMMRFTSEVDPRFELDFDRRREFRASDTVLFAADARSLATAVSTGLARVPNGSAVFDLRKGRGALRFDPGVDDTRDAMLRLELELETEARLTVLREDSRVPVLVRDLELHREIVYARIDALRPGESLRFVFECKPGTVELRGLEMRGVERKQQR